MRSTTEVAIFLSAWELGLKRSTLIGEFISELLPVVILDGGRMLFALDTLPLELLNVRSKYIIPLLLVSRNDTFFRQSLCSFKFFWSCICILSIERESGVDCLEPWSRLPIIWSIRLKMSLELTLGLKISGFFSHWLCKQS